MLTRRWRGGAATATLALLLLGGLASSASESSSGGAGSGTADWKIDSEGDYSAAFDQETSGLFSSLLTAKDPARSLAGYEILLSAYRSILQRLFDDYSPHANSLPRWYAAKLIEIGFGELSTRAPGGIDFFREQLESDDFDRVVHAYFILSHNALPLKTPAGPSALWGEMLAAAKRDSQNRYWISLTLAESRMLPSAEYRGSRTSHVSKFVTVRERVGENAKQLGVQIHRVLGLGPIYGDDPNVSHLYIRYAKEAAADRVRKHHLLAHGADAGYERIRGELTHLEEGEFRSKRLIEIMTKDLVELLDEFGLSDDYAILLARLESLVRDRGGNRFKLRVAFDDLAERYEKVVAASRSPLPVQDETPPPSNEELLARGDEAWPTVLEAFTRPDRKLVAQHFFEQDTVALLLERSQPEDPAALREALRISFESLGYDPAARTGYLHALARLPVPKSADAEAAEQLQVQLSQRFRDTTSVQEYRRSFEELRAASDKRALPDPGPDSELADRYVEAAARVLETEVARLEKSSSRLDAARTRRTEAAATIENAELSVVEANREIQVANDELRAAEDAQSAAVTARNALVAELNGAVRSYERARSAARNAEPGSEEALARDTAEARVAELEGKLDGEVRRLEGLAREAARAGDEAEDRAIVLQQRARGEAAKARAAVSTEEEARVAERKAEAEEQKTRLGIADVIDKAVIGLGLLGVHGSEAELDTPNAPRGARLAGMTLLVERAERGESLADWAASLERESGAGDPLLAALGRLALRLQATSDLQASATSR